MRTNTTLVSITRAGGGPTETRAIRCLFSGATLVDQGGATAKLTGSLIIPHHELVRDSAPAPHGFPKIGDTVVLRPDTAAPGEFGDDTAYLIETARPAPGGALKHWHYTLK